MGDTTTDSEWDAPATALLTDEQALARLIEYAREEAVRNGETVCANLLGAALTSLGGFAAMRREPRFAQSSALGLF